MSHVRIPTIYQVKKKKENKNCHLQSLLVGTEQNMSQKVTLE